MYSLNNNMYCCVSVFFLFLFFITLFFFLFHIFLCYAVFLKWFYFHMVEKKLHLICVCLAWRQNMNSYMSYTVYSFKTNSEKKYLIMCFTVSRI